MNAYQTGQAVLLGDYSQYTPTGKSYFTRCGRYFKQPVRGDVVYFYSQSLGRVSHVGWVENVVWKMNGHFDLFTIEGNTSANQTEFNRNGGICARKAYYDVANVGGGNRIDGFGRPKYSDDTITIEDVEEVLHSLLGYEEKASWDMDQLFTLHGNPGKNNITMQGYWYARNKKIAAQWCQQNVCYAFYMAAKAKQEQKWTGWRKDDSGNWYFFLEGDPIKGRWSHIDGRWYVFDESGKAITGTWFHDKNGEWYYMNDDSAMLSSQWLEYQGKWYYLTATGAMATNAYIKNKSPKGPEDSLYYWVNEKGEWEPQWNTNTPYLELYDLAE